MKKKKTLELNKKLKLKLSCCNCNLLTTDNSSSFSPFLPNSNPMGNQNVDESNILEASEQDNTASKQSKEEEEATANDEDLHRLLLPDISNLPLVPPSSIQANFVSYFAKDFMKPGHDQYVYRHANGLCVIGLASTHVAFKDDGGIKAVDFNVGKSDRSGIKVTGKRKKNAQHFESNTALCKVCTKDSSYIVRCCVKGSLLEVNEKLIKQPELLNSSADREGYIAIMMPRPADWQKIKTSLQSPEEYKQLKESK